MRTARITQGQLNQVWEGHRLGWSIPKIQQSTGVSQDVIRATLRENRKFAPGANSEEYEAAVEKFISLCERGQEMRSSAHQCGLTYHDAYGKLGDHQRAMRRERQRQSSDGFPRPAGITAAPESDRWWIQNQENYVQGMLAHPEMRAIYEKAQS